MSSAYTPKSASSALEIGKIVLTMLAAAAKINQSSIVPAFDQTGVPRLIQVPVGAANSLRKGLSFVGGPKSLGIRSLLKCPPCMAVSRRRAVGYCRHLNVLQYDSGFAAMSSRVRDPSEFVVYKLFEIILENHSQTKTHVRS
jgi:hypothetical protein